MTEETPLTSDFDKAAAPLPETDFAAALTGSFGASTARSVLAQFEKLGLPAPEAANEFVAGTAGHLLFLNRYGIVLRIESEDTSDKVLGQYSYDRVNDSPWVLQPIASIRAGKAVIELCPGVNKADDEMIALELSEKLKGEGLTFWDNHAGNVGYVPVKTPQFPKGVPVVVDRGAVNRLTLSIGGIRNALHGFIGFEKQEVSEAAEAQANLYRPLCDRFRRGWQGEVPMARFWDLCRKYKDAGKLVSGWQGQDGFITRKAMDGAAAGRAYDARNGNKAETQVPPQGQKFKL